MAKYDPDEFFSAERMTANNIFAGSISADRIAYDDGRGFYDPTTDEVIKVSGKIISPYSLSYNPEHGFTTNRKPTNADRIRAMSDEDLAKFLSGIDSDMCPKWKPDSGYDCLIPNCELFITDCWLDWLRQEVEI